jgi:CBS domain containing-hemolysin-like protein
VDDQGTTLGVATLEDVIEELVGEIRDSAHQEAPAPQAAPPADRESSGTDG